MNRPRSDIIPFIAKQLKYKILPVDVLLDVCISAYSAADIVNARNIVVDAFGHFSDFSLPRPTRTNSLRADLLHIFHYLGQFPCAVGQERAYTEYIEKLALVARLDGMSEIVRSLCNTLKPNVTMPSRNVQTQEQSSNPVDPGSQDAPARREESPIVIPVPPPIVHEELNVIERPSVDSLPMPDISVDQVSAPLPDLGLQALSVNPPIRIPAPVQVRVVASLPPIQILGRRDQQNPDEGSAVSPSIEVVSPPIVQEHTPAIRVASVPAPAPAVAPTPEPGSLGDNLNTNQDDSLTDPVDDELSSMSSVNSSSSSSSESSEEDNLPLSFYNPGRFPRNRPSILGPLGRQAQRWTTPATGRFEGRPPRSQPIQIPPPTRLLHRAEDWNTDDESAPSDTEPTSSKRRRSEHRSE